MSAPVISARRLRLEVRVDESRAPQDVRTNATPVLYLRNDTRMELGFTWNGALADMSAFALVEVEVYDQAGALRAAAEVASLTANPDAAGWTAGTDQHAVADLTDEQTNFAGVSANVDWTLEITGTTSAGKKVTLGRGAVTIQVTWHNESGAPDPADPVFLNAAQIGALFVPLHADLAQWKWDGTKWLTFNEDDGNWYPIIVRNVGGAPALALGDPE